MRNGLAAKMAQTREVSQRRFSTHAPSVSQAACPHCGGGACASDELVTKRGAIVVAYDPIIVLWRDRAVPLSRTEAHIYAFICRRGRVTYDEIAQELQRYGASAGTRSLILGHIRRKFLSLGACDPFERLGNEVIRLRVDPDECGRTTPVIGLKLPRFATAK